MALATSARQRIFNCRVIPCCSHRISRQLAVAVRGSKDSGASGQELRQAREWLSSFNAETIPKSIFEVTFARSSGPGGQNVNKINSKATLKVPLHSLLQHVPILLHQQIRASRFYKQGSDAIVIQADENRKQSDNANSCYVKLHNIIVEAAAEAVPGETSDAQKEKVKGLQKAANSQRLRDKRSHSQKKSSRKGGGKGTGEW